MSIDTINTTPLRLLDEEQLMDAFQETLDQMKALDGEIKGTPLQIVQLAQQASQTLILTAIYKRLVSMDSKE